MIGTSWGGQHKGGGVEVWGNGIIVTVGPAVSEMLADYAQILQIYNMLGDWLDVHTPEICQTPLRK